MEQNDFTFKDDLDWLIQTIGNHNYKKVVFVLVEGDTDIRLFKKFFNENKCKVEKITGGNPQLEISVERLLNVHKLIIGIRDADFIHLNGIEYDKENMFLTDFHDIEMTLIHNDSTFSAILFDFLSDLGKQEHNKVREKIFKIIEQVSLLRWLNDLENLELNFNKLSFRELIDLDKLSIKFEEYFSNICSKSPNAKIKNFEIITEEIQKLREKNPNYFQLSNGHDFVDTLYRYIQGTKKSASLSKEAVEAIFRTNFRKEDFEKTILFDKIKKWADSLGLDIF